VESTFNFLYPISFEMESSIFFRNGDDPNSSRYKLILESYVMLNIIFKKDLACLDMSV